MSGVLTGLCLYIDGSRSVPVIYTHFFHPFSSFQVKKVEKHCKEQKSLKTAKKVF